MMTILIIIVKETRLSLMKIKSYISHAVDETFNIKKQEVIDFIDYNHKLVPLVCSTIDEFSINKQSFNLLKFEIEHYNHQDSHHKLV